MSAATLPQAIQAALLRGATILTPAERAAHGLRAVAAAVTGPDAPIHALDAWFGVLWREMTLAGETSRLLLNATQEQAVFRQVIGADPETPALQSPDTLAALAASAYRSLQLANGRTRLDEFAGTTDSKAFGRWLDAFERVLRQQRLLTSAQLPGALTAALAEGKLPIPNEGVLLVDFDELAPAHAALFDALTQAQYTVERLETAVAAPARLSHAAPDPATELLAAAHWVRETLERDPSSRIAVVVPNLAERRAEMDRVFRAVLAPELNHIDAASVPGPFEFSLGTPLAETPLAATAFGLLRLAMSSQSLSAVGQLLLAPSFGTAGPLPEQLAVAEFEAYELHDQHVLRPECSLETLVQLAARSERAARMPGLLGRLRALHGAARASFESASGRQPHAAWSDEFRTILQTAGWSGAAKASGSLGFQTHRSWQSALDELATLDFDGTRPTASEALDALERIARATIFSVQGQGAPVQILGPLEPGGLPFDALWFLSAGDLSWPVPPASNPLLPWQLARSLGLPGTVAAHDHAAACRLTERLASGAAEVVFSYPVLVDGVRQRPSPALAGIALEPLAVPELPGAPDALPLEAFADEDAIAPLPDHRISGGAGILQQQAACAFRAFAAFRLHSTELTRRTDGLDAGERGSLVHKVMELFWQGLADQRELKLLTMEVRRVRLEESIDTALERHQRGARSAWDHAYLATQRIRLRSLLEPWLAQELDRPPFAVRVSEKTLEDVAIGPLRLTLRVDRIDETAGGDLILDYKTGNANPTSWRTERPDAPQLPLYAVLASEQDAQEGVEQRIAGVAFVQLRPGKELKMTGFADTADVFGPQTAEMDAATFPEQLDAWHGILTGLAEDFAHGVATVDPKAYPGTCKFCAHRILCRIAPESIADDDPEFDPESTEAEEHVHG